ncbi:fimbrial protein [Pseudescherichia vulneris]
MKHLRIGGLLGSLLLLMTLWRSMGWACTLTSGSPNIQINIGSLTIQRDIPVGTVIYGPVTSSVVSYSCGVGPLSYSYTPVTYSTRSSTNYIYATNIPGVGISYLNGTWLPYSYSGSNVVAGTFNNAAAVSLVKIGDIPVGTNVLNPGVLYNVTLTGISGSAATATLLPGTTVNVLACSVSSSNIAVKLDDVYTSSLTAIGTTAKPTGFNLGLNCAAGARVNVTFQGVANTDTSAPGVLQLSNAGGNGVAKGVGIQILYNGYAVNLNGSTPLILGMAGDGVQSYPFTAQYYQTKSTVSEGAANATATMTLTYQ